VGNGVMESAKSIMSSSWFWPVVIILAIVLFFGKRLKKIFK
jgi:Sec-independent protein translocase protein TatA